MCICAFASRNSAPIIKKGDRKFNADRPKLFSRALILSQKERAYEGSLGKIILTTNEASLVATAIVPLYFSTMRLMLFMP